MTKIRLSLLKGNVVSIIMMRDAELLKTVSIEKIVDFLKWVVRFQSNKESYVDDDLQKLVSLFKLKSVDELVGAQRFAATLFFEGACLSRADLETDLKSLDFKQEAINQILETLEDLWKDYQDYLVRVRDEAIPVLYSLRWRVDVRRASSDYLRESEVVALVRIGTSDGTRRDQFCIELDEDKLSWLEIVIGKIKREMLKTKEA